MTIDKIENKIKECEDIKKNKMIIEFNEQNSASVDQLPSNLILLLSAPQGLCLENF